MTRTLRLWGFTQKGVYEVPKDERVILYPHDLSYGLIGRVFFPENVTAISVPAETKDYRISPRIFKRGISPKQLGAIGGTSGLGLLLAKYLAWLPGFGLFFPAQIIPMILSIVLMIMIFVVELSKTAHSKRILEETIEDIEIIPLHLTLL
jgi:hypothetical protein